MDKEDVVQVVRCKDCEQCYSEIAAHSGKRVHYCKMLRETFGQDAEVNVNFFCQNGKKRAEQLHVDYERRKIAYQKAIDMFGERNRIEKATEELSELLCELSRKESGRTTRRKIADEIADVTIMCEQLRLLFDMNEEVADRMDYKVRRLEERLEKENG